MKSFLHKIFSIIIVFQFSCLSEGQIESHIPFNLEKYNSIRFQGLRLGNQFEKIKWKDSLSLEDIDLFLEALDTSNVMFRGQYGRGYRILVPSLIHRFNLSKERENSVSEEDRELFDLTGEMTDKEFDEYLYSLIIPECLVKNLKITMTHYHCKGDDYLNVLVTRQCKLLRNGQEPNFRIPDSLLNKRQEYLLEYSKLEPNIAIEKLHELAKVYDVKNNTYYGQISMTLGSYGREATLKTYSVVMDKSLLKEYSEFGKLIIVNHLSFKSIEDLNNEEIHKLMKRLNSINFQEEKIDKAKNKIIQLKALIENYYK